MFNVLSFHVLMLSCSMFSFSCFMLSGFIFHFLIFSFSCSVSHLIFPFFMFSFFTVRVPCFHFSFAQLHFHVSLNRKTPFRDQKLMRRNCTHAGISLGLEKAGPKGESNDYSRELLEKPKGWAGRSGRLGASQRFCDLYVGPTRGRPAGHQ